MAIDSTSETAIIEWIVLPADQGQSEEAARSILALDFCPEDQERMRVLADKVKQATLTPEEEQEIDNYERVGHYLSILQSKALGALRQSHGPNSSF